MLIEYQHVLNKAAAGVGHLCGGGSLVRGGGVGGGHWATCAGEWH